MKRLEQIFTMHPVGQGFFYSCKLSIEDKVRFRMVFDCGSKTSQAGQTEVAEYRKDPDYLKEKVLDLLVISHFDADHVSHIKKLLKDDVKVRRLVMPFVTFEERLFLSIRHTVENPLDEDADGAVDFIMDPLSALSEHLDDDSEIYLVDSDDAPIPDSEIDLGDDGTVKLDDTRVKFEIDGKGEPINEEKLWDIGLRSSTSKVYKVGDKNKGKCGIGINTHLMEFLFYKRSMGHAEGFFFETLKSKFDDTYIKDPAKLDKNGYLDAVITAIKTMPSATKWKPLINKVIKELGGKEGLEELGLDSSVSDLKNLNTTALCMLHKNLKGLYNLGTSANDHRHYSFDFHSIQKFGASGLSRTETQFNYERYSYWWQYWHIPDLSICKYPNTLLTSDTFLLEEGEVNSFLSKYQNYWSSFWMFQVPHHGSKNNSNRTLLSQIPQDTSLFINYGTRNGDHHPDSEVVNDIVTTGHSSNLFSVNEFTGWRFSVYGPGPL